MAYECVCFKCNKSFFAVSKRASICPNCKSPDAATGCGDDALPGSADDWRNVVNILTKE